MLMYCSDSTQNSNTDFHYDNHVDSVAYVGMKTCATCHQDKHQTFIHTGMGLSFDSATRQKSSAFFGSVTKSMIPFLICIIIPFGIMRNFIFKNIDF